MPGVTGDIGGLAQLIAKFKQISSGRTRKVIVSTIAEEYTNFMSRCFDDGRGPYGEVWKPLDPKFRVSAKGQPGQKPLLNTGALRTAALATRNGTHGFSVAVSRMYASIHQFGATIRAKRARWMVFGGYQYAKVYKAVKSGKDKVKLKSRLTRTKFDTYFAKVVKIPARPFAPLKGMPPELDAAAMEAVEEVIEEIFLR
ncbi:MAG: phage virion morphogenesis protein [Polyangiaceae bacterium]|nr:phage virion morphogenesis protein [Polyangiaceae bacterium]